MQVQHNISAMNLTTFGLTSKFEHLVHVTSVSELNSAIELAKQTHSPLHVIGGGSNVLVPEVLPGYTIRIEIVGKEVVDETATTVRVKFGAGENWHQTVAWCVERGYAGLENLALIPGTVGAAPIQNIGAYGVEQEQCFVELEAVDRQTGLPKVFDKTECEFAYRNSVFKNALVDGVVIVSVTYELRKGGTVNVKYKDLATELNRLEITSPGIADVFNAVVAVRQNKLPDPEIIGNAGSFFKNPVVEVEKHRQLLKAFPELVSFPAKAGVKLAAAWMIDRCGWKGYTNGHVGVHENQALVIIRTGQATQTQVLKLAADIQASVFEKFGVELEREVNVW